MMYVYLGIHSALFAFILFLCHSKKKLIQYHYSMGLTIIVTLANTLIPGILLTQLFPEYYTNVVIAAILIGVLTGILAGVIFDFQSMYSGNVSGVMGGLMGPMIGDTLTQNYTIPLFIFLEITLSGLILLSLYSTQLKREV